MVEVAVEGGHHILGVAVEGGHHILGVLEGNPKSLVESSGCWFLTGTL